MSETWLAPIGALVTFLVGIFGGSGGVIWYLDQRATEHHDALQQRIDRLSDRVSELESDRDEQHDKIISQGRTIADLRSDLADAERTIAAKDAEISRLEQQVAQQQQRIRRLEDASDPTPT